MEHARPERILHVYLEHEGLEMVLVRLGHIELNPTQQRKGSVAKISVDNAKKLILDDLV